MKRLYNWIFTNFEKIYIIFLFLIAYTIVVLLFPGEKKFRYEFQKGQLWLHEDLISPFDFAIFKMDDEIALEKDEVLEGFAPYFTKSEDIKTLNINKLKKDYSSKWLEWLEQYDSLKRLKQTKNLVLYDSDSIRYFFNKTISVLEKIYTSGIIEYDAQIGYKNKTPESIWILKNRIAKEIDYSTIFTLENAYTYLIQQIEEPKPKLEKSKNLQFIIDLELNKYIEPNLFYDKETSTKVKNDQLENISTTRGMLREGEQIIKKGEMVDTDKFRILESLKKEYLSSLEISTNHSLLYVGRFIIVLFVFLTLYLFLSRFREYVLNSRKKTMFILMLVVTTIFITSLVQHSKLVSIYLIPFIIVPILVNTFYESRLALFVHMITVFFTGFYAPNSFEFIFIQFFAGVIAIIGLKKIQRRGQFFSSALLTVLSYFFLYFGIAINREGNIHNIEWMNFAWFAGNGVLILLSFPLVYVFEKTFQFISDVTLMELSDTNQELLREMAEKAPGTFQHSIQVANLSEEVIRSIGGNPLLVRTGALYHDIGKMTNPQYFTENQLIGMNPHDKVSYKESAAIIIAHVSIGLEMAKKAKLPKPIIDFIITHHGTTKTQYFFRLYKKENPNDKQAGINFTYPGPKPFTKETAVLMMADSIEAASRSLKTYSQELLDELVENIIDFQIEEKQFDSAPITFSEISESKRIFKKKLQNIYHTRIEYPKE